LPRDVVLESGFVAKGVEEDGVFVKVGCLPCRVAFKVSEGVFIRPDSLIRSACNSENILRRNAPRPKLFSTAGWEN